MLSEQVEESPRPDTFTALMIGIPSIDREHFDLLGQLEALDGAGEAHPRSASFSEILSCLGQQISAHFDTEEKVLKSLSMPEDDLHRHVEAHTAILDQYTQFNIDLMKGTAFSRSEVCSMIKRWIIDHLEDHDLKIRDFLVTG